MGKDKLLHFLVGAIIALIGTALFGATIGICLAISAGILKEIYDEVDYGGADFLDILATTAGGLTGSGIPTILTYI